MRAFFLIILLLFSALAISAQAKFDEHGRWVYSDEEPVYFPSEISKEDIEEVISLWEKLGDPSKSKNEWGGSYGIYGELHKTLLRWHPEIGYVKLGIYSCAMAITHLEYGRAQMLNDQILFFPKKSAGSGHGGAKNRMLSKRREFVPVKWNGTQFIIENDDIDEFCDYAAGHFSKNEAIYDVGYSGYFSRGGDREASAEELPVLPERFRHLIKKPLAGSLISIGKRIVKKADSDNAPYYMQPYHSRRQVTINLGEKDGVKKGMIFYLLPKGDLDGGDIEIVKVSGKSSIGIIDRSLIENKRKSPFRWRDSKDYAILKAGDRITSSIHIYREMVKEDPYIPE